MKSRILLFTSLFLGSAAHASDFRYDDSLPTIPSIPFIKVPGGSGGDGGDGGGSGSGGGSGGGSSGGSNGGGNSAPLFNHDEDEEDYWYQLEQEYYDYLDELEGYYE